MIKKVIIVLIFISCLLHAIPPASEEYILYDDYKKTYENYRISDKDKIFDMENNVVYINENAIDNIIKSLLSKNIEDYFKGKSNQYILKKYIVMLSNEIVKEKVNLLINTDKIINQIDSNITKILDNKISNLFYSNSDFINKIEFHSTKILEQNIDKFFDSNTTYIQSLISDIVDNIIREKELNLLNNSIFMNTLKTELYKNDSMFMDALMYKITEKIDEKIKNLEYEQPTVQKNNDLDTVEKKNKLEQYLDKHVSENEVITQTSNKNNFIAENNDNIKLTQYKKVNFLDFYNNIITWYNDLVDFKFGDGGYKSVQLIYSIILVIVIILILIPLLKGILNKLMIFILIIVMYYFWYIIVFQTNINIIYLQNRQNQILNDKLNNLTTRINRLDKDINNTFDNYNKNFNFIDIQMNSLFIKKKSKDGRSFILVPKCSDDNIHVEIK